MSASSASGPDSGNLGADHGGVTRRRMVLHVPLQVPVGRLGVAVQGQLPEHRCSGQRRGGSEEAPACELGLRQD